MNHTTYLVRLFDICSLKDRRREREKETSRCEHTRFEQDNCFRQLFYVSAVEHYCCCCRLQIHFSHKCSRILSLMKSSIYWQRQAHRCQSSRIRTILDCDYEIQEFFIVRSATDRQNTSLSSDLFKSLHEWHCCIFQNSEWTSATSSSDFHSFWRTTCLSLLLQIVFEIFVDVFA